MAKEKGNKEAQKVLPKFDWKKFQRDRITYKWQYYNKKHDHYFSYQQDDRVYDTGLLKGEEKKECIEVHLYRSPEKPPYDFYIKHANWQLAVRVEFFKEVFDERAFIEGYQPSTKYSIIIIPPDIHHNILNTINNYGLLPIRDLIVEIIAIAQDIYVRDVARWERPFYQKLINTAEKETEKAIEIIEKSGVDYKSLSMYKGKIKPELKHINFVFNDGTIKLEHAWLAKEFIEHTKEYYEGLPYKDWKKDLARYPERFQENAYRSKFKYRLAKSLYNMLTGISFFKVTDKQPYPNKLMLCIANIIEYCLIPVASFEETDSVKIKHIRNWLKRGDLKPALTFAEVPVNKELLQKYFEAEFLNMADDRKRADAISIAFYVCKRFDIEPLLPDLIHIVSCIQETNWLIGHQMTSSGSINEPEVVEFKNFKSLMNGVKDNKKITSVKFTIEGEDGEMELAQRLPLYLIEEALREYYKSDQIEFDADTLPTTYKKTQPGEISIKKEPQFNLPHERHLVRLVHSLYNFLKDHSGIDEGEILPGEQYYEIIATIFKESWVFYNKMVDDRSVIQKIKQWHSLNEES